MLFYMLIWILMFSAFISGLVLGIVTTPTVERTLETQHAKYANDEDREWRSGRSNAKYVTAHVLNRDKWVESSAADGLDSERN